MAKDADGACSQTQNEFVLSVYNSKIMVLFSSTLTTGNVVYAGGSTSITDTSHWYHVVALYDGTITTNSGLDRVKIYVDNIQDVVSAALPPLGVLGNIQAGSAALGTGTTLTTSGTPCAASSYDFHGKIDDIRIYNRLINTAEIAAIYAGATNVGIIENNNTISCDVFPNPSSGKFEILINDNTSKKNSITVFNALGEIIYKEETEKNIISVDLSAKAKGIYFAEIKTEKGTATKKIVVEK